MARKRSQTTADEADSQTSSGSNPLSEGFSPDLDQEWLARVRADLVVWYRQAGRSLPWRDTQDPYRILVSEMMLVQTTVAAVVPYFARFLDRFPTVETLASADEGDVLKIWEGLGYYRRARQLQSAAQVVMRLHGGVFPRDPIAIRALPGVGRYIAGAIQSFAFDQPAPIVEANTQRVLARWLAWPGELQSTRTQSRLWDASARIVPETGSGEFNQAFMELGALLCVPRVPLCLTCPVAFHCHARQEGLQDRLPVVRARVAPKAVAEACALIRRGDRYLILKRGAGRLWEHFWEFPTLHLGGANPAGRSLGADLDLATGLAELTGLEVEVGPVATTVRFGVTTHKVQLNVHNATWQSGEVTLRPGWVEAAWVHPDQLADYTLGSATRKVGAWLKKSSDPTKRDH